METVQNIIKGNNKSARFQNYLHSYYRRETAKQSEKEFPSVNGTQVTELDKLIDHDYLVINGLDPSVRFIVRRDSHIFSTEFQAQTSRLIVSLQQAQNTAPIRILGYQTSLDKLFVDLFEHQRQSVLKQYGSNSGEEFFINFGIKIDKLRMPVHSGLFQLTQSNGPFLVGTLLDALTRTLISSSPESQLQNMEISVSVMRSNAMSGNGFVVITSPKDFQLKSFHPKNRKRGSVLMCRASEDCFYVAAHVQYRYNQLEAKVSEIQRQLKALTKHRSSEKRILREKLKQIMKQRLELATEKGDSQREKALTFYEKQNIDIAKYEVGSLKSLAMMYDVFNSQISIYDQANHFKRRIIYPPHFSPTAVAINLIRVVQIPTLNIGDTKKSLQYHYHACRSISGLVSSQGMKLCLYCSQSFGRGHKIHNCTNMNSYSFCKSCANTLISDDEYKQIHNPELLQLKFCVTGGKAVAGQCPTCTTKYNSEVCRAHHTKEYCKAIFTCTKCKRRVQQIGKYRYKDSEPKPTRHDNCLEILCLHCNDYVPMEDENGAAHVCYIKRPIRASQFPAGLACFDIEAIVQGKTFRAVTIGMIFQKEAQIHEDFHGIFFSEVGEKYGSIPHGTSFVVNEIPKTYLPYDILREAPVHKNQPKNSDYLQSLPPQSSTERDLFIPILAPAAPELTAVGRFIKFILQPRFKNYVFVSHYGRGYDNLFILAHLLDNGIKCKVLFVGHKILSLKIVPFNITFTDMMCYCPMSLRKMGQGFGLEVQKDFFPFSLFQKENFNLVRPNLPTTQEYEMNAMAPDVQTEFQLWHEENKNSPFDMCQTVHEYCMKDCAVLMLSMQNFIANAFRIEADIWRTTSQEIMENMLASESPIIHNGTRYHLINNHPFSRDFCTAPSYCNHLHLSTTPIQLPIYDNQYESSPMFTSSQGEVDYCQHLIRTRFPNLRYQLSANGQKKLRLANGSMCHLDGYDSKSKTAVEYYGCFYHNHVNSACQWSWKKSDNFRTYGADRYLATKIREKLILQHPQVNELVTIWECQWTKLVKNDKILEDIIQNREPIHHAAIRSAFKGGHTSVGILYANRDKIIKTFLQKNPHIGREWVEDNVDIVMLDINSQYPSQFLTEIGQKEPAIRVPTSPPITIYHPRTEQTCDKDCCPYQNHTQVPECYLTKTCSHICPLHCPPNAWINGDAVGYANVRILPSRDTRYPLLTVKVKRHGESAPVNIATLCRKCAETYKVFYDVKPCDHDEEDRAIDGTWNLHELKFAVREQGYKILRVNSTVFFQSYRSDILLSLMTALAKTKICSAGIPNGRNIDEYIEEINLQTGYGITREDFKHASLALRMVAKILMVSVIGKQAQSKDKNQKDLCYDYSEFLRVIEKPDQEMTYFELLRENCLMVHTKPKIATARTFCRGSLFLTSYCNSLSREMLIKSAMKLADAGWLVGYFDTDSMLAVSTSPMVPPLTTLLDIHPVRIGAWKVEHDRIQSFSILQKKTYSLLLKNGKMICKAKGFHSFLSLLQINDLEQLMPQELAIILAGNEPRNIQIYQNKFVIKKGTYTIDVLPDERAFRKLTVIGPRKYCDPKAFITLKKVHWNSEQLRNLRVVKYPLEETNTQRCDNTEEIIIADISGILPLFPFGFKGDKNVQTIKYLERE